MGEHANRLRNLFEMMNTHGPSLFDDPEAEAFLPNLVDADALREAGLQ
jgi:hypothetical protein